MFPFYSSVPVTSPAVYSTRAVETIHFCQGSLTVHVINCNVTFPSWPSFLLKLRAMNNNNFHISVSCKLHSSKNPAKSSTTDHENTVLAATVTSLPYFRIPCCKGSPGHRFPPPSRSLIQSSSKGKQAMNSSSGNSSHWW